MALIPLTVLRTNSTDYYATTGKPSIKTVAVPEDLSAVISSIKSAITVWSTAAGSLPGGSSITLSRSNDAYPEVIWVAETMPQIQTALSKATGVTNAYATESIAVTPHSGGGQGSAVPLTKYFTTASPAANGDSVLLPLAANSTNKVYLIDNTAAFSTAVFPTTGDIIDNNAANASVSVLATSITYFWSNGVQWYSIPMVS